MNTLTLPDSWNNLQDFVHWFKSNNYPQLPPKNAHIYQTDISISVCVFRHGLYQVEFYISKPNFVSSKHYHPFEQVIIFMGGSGKGRRGFRLHQETEWTILDESKIGKTQDVLMPYQWHQISAFDHGLYFYNCQKWSSEEMMTSAVVEYKGESLGPMHDQILR